MKTRFLFFLALAAMLSACHEQDTLIGTWTVDKVHVQFDENRTTPELVKQIGEMERQNTFSISTDSTLVFNGLDLIWQGRVSLVGDSLLIVDGRDFGTWREGHIVTLVDSPLGEVMVTYRRE